MISATSNNRHCGYYLLCARHCSKCLEINSEQNKDPCHRRIHISAERRQIINVLRKTSIMFKQNKYYRKIWSQVSGGQIQKVSKGEMQ